MPLQVWGYSWCMHHAWVCELAGIFLRKRVHGFRQFSKGSPAWTQQTSRDCVPTRTRPVKSAGCAPGETNMTPGAGGWASRPRTGTPQQSQVFANRKISRKQRLKVASQPQSGDHFYLKAVWVTPTPSVAPIKAIFCWRLQAI